MYFVKQTNKQKNWNNKQKIDVDRDMMCFVDILIRLNSIKSRELVQVIWLNGRHEFGDYMFNCVENLPVTVRAHPAHIVSLIGQN